MVFSLHWRNAKEKFAPLARVPDAMTLHKEIEFENDICAVPKTKDSERVRDGLRDILLGPARLYEALRAEGRISK